MKQQEEKAKGLENVEEILTDDFGNWEVKDDGDIEYHGTALGTKSIPKEDLKNVSLSHMLNKFKEGSYKDGVDYYYAYLRALHNAGYKTLTIDLENIHKAKVE